MTLLGLHVGVSFLEITLLKSGQCVGSQRIYLPRLPLKAALQKFLLGHENPVIDRIYLISSHLDKLAPFRLGGSTAHLVTEGFENLGWLSQTSANAQRFPAVQSQDLVFAVQERISSTGEIITPLDLSYLQTVAAKLKAMDIKKVCLHFLHSNKNTAHTDQAQNLLRELGFETFTLITDSEFDIEKSRRVCLNAALSNPWEELQNDIKEGTQFQGDIFVPENGEFRASTSVDAVMGLSSLEQFWSLLPFENIVYLGFENFVQIFPKDLTSSWLSPWGSAFRSSCRKKNLSLQPTSAVRLNFFNEVDVGTTSEGFEPGPVALGRGQKLTFFDLFFDELSLLSELNAWISPQAGSRIQSGLSALSKSSRENQSTQILNTQMKIQSIQHLMAELEPKPSAVYMGFWSHILAPVLKIKPHPGSLSEMVGRLGGGFSL